MEGLVHRTVTKIKTACGRATKYKELRDLCDDILTKVSENNKNGNPLPLKEEEEGMEDGPGQGLSTFGRDRRESSSSNNNFGLLAGNISNVSIDTENIIGSADEYFDVYKRACESKNPKIMEIALDGIQKLVAHGYLTGGTIVSAPDEEEKNNNLLLGDLANNGNNNNNQRQNRSNTTGDPSTTENDTTSGDTIYLIDIIIQTIFGCEHSDDNVQLQIIKALLTCISSPQCQVHHASLLLAVRACYNIHVVSKNQVNKTTAKATLTQMLNIIFHRMEVYDLRMKEYKDINEEVNLQQELSSPLALEGTKKVNNKDALTLENKERNENTIYESVFLALNFIPENKMKIQNEKSVSSSGIGSNNPEFPSILHKDCYLLFRALCKLSNKSVSEGDTLQLLDPIALQSKILSLELILSILDNSGLTFRSNEKFLFLFRQYLCVSLLKNATSSNNQIVSMSLRIFVSMMNNFKDHLKAEMEIFISNIFLKILESENTTFDHKMSVLQVLYSLAQDPIALVEIFVNYDCDFGATNMFKRIIDALSRIAKGKIGNQGQNIFGLASGGLSDMIQSSAAKGKQLSEEYSLRILGLEGLVSISQSLVKCAGLGDGSPTTTNSLKKAGSKDPLSPLSSPRELNSDGEKIDNIIIEESKTTTGNGQDENATIPSKMESNIPLSDSVVESFDRKQRLQQEMETGMLKFSLSPKKGIDFFLKTGHIDQNTPQAVAKFLHDYSKNLDKTAIGEYLGKEEQYNDGFCVKVLHAYVDMMDFTDLEFDEAIRHYLGGFRLPGEAQKIDRFMEKFAERFCIQNPNVFPTADTAFILAFSIIMLNTDLHNPAIKEEKKMTKQAFFKNNETIADGKDLPIDFQEGIYDRIKKNQIAYKIDSRVNFSVLCMGPGPS